MNLSFTTPCRQNWKSGFLAAALVLLPLSPALAQSSGTDTSGSQSSGQQSKLPQPDRGFLKQAAHGGMLQVALSTVAAEQADDPKVRRFAVKSLKDFAMAGGMLHAIAEQLGHPLPTQPPQDVKKLRSALAADSPGQIDHEYLAMIGPPSDVAVNLFQDEAQSGQVPQLKNFAQKMLPKLQKHNQETLAMLTGNAPSATGGCPTQNGDAQSSSSQSSSGQSSGGSQ